MLTDNMSVSNIGRKKCKSMAEHLHIERKSIEVKVKSDDHSSITGRWGL